jgi:8-oxo-dGTP diphosphatase
VNLTRVGACIGVPAARNVADNVASKTIQSAGGIVVRDGARALFAVVQRSKDDAWVLPRGKLKRNENPVTGARREVVEETGHRVRVHEFLGVMTYRAGGRPKVVQFWRMEAEAEASYDLMADIAAVEWLPLKAAVRRLSYPLEKLFLRNIGRRAAAHRERGPLDKPQKSSGRKADKSAGKSASQLSKRKPAKAASKKASKSANKKVKKTAAKPTKNATKKPKRKLAARSHKRNTGSHAVKTPARPSKSVNADKSVRRKTAKSAATKHAAHKLGPHKPSLHKHGPTKHNVPVTTSPERALTAQPVKPATAAERKSILQRMLGRLAG